MKLPSSPLPIRPVSIPELARRAGMARATVFRNMKELHARCRAGTCESEFAADPDHPKWMTRPSEGKWRVNESLLRRGHPEVFNAPTLEGVREAAENAMEHSVLTRKMLMALGGRVKERFREHLEEHHGQRRDSEPPAGPGKAA